MATRSTRRAWLGTLALAAPAASTWAQAGGSASAPPVPAHPMVQRQAFVLELEPLRPFHRGALGATVAC